ncbi:MAG: HD domain-containing protein [bacterium]
MNNNFKKEPFLTISRIAKKRGSKFFLVGGFIRDYLLKKPSKDIDFCFSEDPIGFARDVSNVLKGAFVLLDENCGRVVLKDITLDFTRIEGDIERDIKRRDFTINSLAMKGPSFSEIIDLTDGISDIQKGVIKMVSKNSLIEDPLRLLRAVRFSSSLNFEIEKETIKAIKENAYLIKNVASERINYELFEILKNKKSYKFLKVAFSLGILSEVIKELIPLSQIEGRGYHHLDLLEHSFETVKQIEIIADNFLFIEYLERVREYLNEAIASDHTRLSILKLVGLLHDLGKPETIKEEDGRLRFIGHERLGEKYVQGIGKRLKFSHNEIQTMARITLNHMRIGTLVQGGVITKKAVFRLFKDLGDDLIMLLILSLADRYSAVGEATTKEDIENHEKGIKKILDFIFSEKEPIKPPKIVNGKELMKRFSLKESPLIGKLLFLIEEAWIEGKIKNKKDAFKVVEGYLEFRN